MAKQLYLVALVLSNDQKPLNNISILLFDFCKFVLTINYTLERLMKKD